ncbi:response regulator transcription factor [Marinoscillum furvescens]|uniref:Regulatory LuxR family protein n=1 Tax=Marinoscillum furvescens DSM 4134 TaxID=1122208 RepID=A0A3D9KWU9_MARFU|nr:helix-turn-helix transcriptional regulator [Marinoscillum furvescens]RED91741.1 regulatory LuxR family protein [Marinoscillum furvescens DSM 4134]
MPAKTAVELNEDIRKNFAQANISGESKYVDVFSLPIQKPIYEVQVNRFTVNPNAKVAGFSANELPSLEHYYDIMLPEDRAFILDYSSNLVSYMGNNFFNDDHQLLEESSHVTFRMKGKRGKIYTYKRISILNGICQQKISSNVSYLEDITWLGSSNIRKWKTEGKNLIGFDYNMPELALLRNTLSGRELEILRLLARGFSSSDIANGLLISIHTVKTHRKNMLRKLEAANTAELLSIARDLKLF